MDNALTKTDFNFPGQRSVYHGNREELLVVGHGHLVTGERVVDVVGERLAERFRVGAEHFDFFCFLGCFCHD